MKRGVYFTLGGTSHPSASVCVEHKLLPGLSVNRRWLFSPVIFRAVLSAWWEDNTSAPGAVCFKLSSKKPPQETDVGFQVTSKFFCDWSQENFGAGEVLTRRHRLRRWAWVMSVRQRRRQRTLCRALGSHIWKRVSSGQKNFLWALEDTQIHPGVDRNIRDKYRTPPCHHSDPYEP